MSPTQKKHAEPGGGGAGGRTIHESGVTMPRSLFARLDRIVERAQLRSRGELLLLGLTIILDMCEDSAKRYLPDLVLQYDKNRPENEVEPRISNPSKAQRCGTNFSQALEDRIKAAVRPIGWSRNQFIIETARILVEWCENPAARGVPLVVLLYETAIAYTVPLKLKRKP